MQTKELVQRIKSKKMPVVVDVRSGFEFNGGHIPGAIHAPNWWYSVSMARGPRWHRVF